METVTHAYAKPNGLLKSLRPPRPRTEFCRHNGLLALFHDQTDQASYWRHYWESPYVSVLRSMGRTADLGEYEQAVVRYIPKGRPVLEAGCGPAHIVEALHNRGYDAIGVDYEPEVVGMVNATCPHLHVQLGDVKSLEFPDGYFGGILSLGVVEHFEEGPEQAIAEMRRVIHQDGVALIEVPYLNPLRTAFLSRLRKDGPTGGNMSFYQYYFALDDFQSRLAQGGFEVVDHVFVATESFIIREHPLFSRLWNSRGCREFVKSLVRQRLKSPNGNVRRRYAHMAVYVCRPK